MKIENSTIIFKSFPENYDPEFSGKKPNTLRVIPKDELSSFKIINGVLIVEETPITNIKIINATTNSSFTKPLTWVTQFNNELLFSWNNTINAVHLYDMIQCQQIKLDANNHKRPYTELEMTYIMSRLLEEVKELDFEVFSNAIDPIKVCDEAVDVANFALFVFSKYAVSIPEYQSYINTKYDEIRSRHE